MRPKCVAATYNGQPMPAGIDGEAMVIQRCEGCGSLHLAIYDKKGKAIATFSLMAAAAAQMTMGILAGSTFCLAHDVKLGKAMQETNAAGGDVKGHA